MRIKNRNNKGITVHAISGTYVVMLAFNAPESATKNLLGFAIHRTDHTENEAYWLKGFKTFEETEPDTVPGKLYPTHEHPVQSFSWSDFTAKTDHKYTYKVVPVYGKPKKPEYGEAVEVTIETESEDKGTHAVFFNRGVAGSQAYVRKFGYKKPDQLSNKKEAFKWLSRGVEEAILSFIEKAKNGSFALRASVYEFNYEPVIEAFKDAWKRGVDVKIIYDSRKDYPKKSSDEKIKKHGIRDIMIRRTQPKSYISHNKFIVLLKNDEPIEVLGGSTNFTKGGIFGQSNVVHIVRDRATAENYYRYWSTLAGDPTSRKIKSFNEQLVPNPQGEVPDDSITTIFSPRKSLHMLHWYAKQMDNAKESINLTAAFGVNSVLASVLEKDKEELRFLLVEKKGKTYDVYSADKDVLISIGSYLKSDILEKWTRESLTEFNHHVRYIHTKYMLIDPLSKNPITITGSANFSIASTVENDENMLIIKGDQRVADIYLGEFFRLFNHFYFRYIANKLKSRDQLTKKSAFLKPDDSWCQEYYEIGSIKEKRRNLFG
jgi:phosphatidylserine/phosphatidylglycerophosphate/cardiolipin synthase-like enzyme